MSNNKNILITGAAGFIGSHLLRLMVLKYPSYNFVNLDLLTYAGNLENIQDVEDCPNYTFVKGDICEEQLVRDLFDKHKFTGVIHLAAESHVDRSIEDPMAFIRTNIIGTVNLLNAAKNAWQENYEGKLFYHVSTDEVYGSLGEIGLFTESTSYDPRSPYSSSKASSDHFVRAYGNTYGLPFVISNCSNNYGANQFPEKLIPLFIHNIVQNKPLPVYGNGQYTRDWLYVLDHVSAIDTIFHKGKIGDTYNIGGLNEWANINLIRLLCQLMDKKLKRDKGSSAKLITYVKDRPGHDKRYAIDASKLCNELGWRPSVDFKEGLSKTIDWYIENEQWMNNVTSGAYKDYYQKQYGK
jgi:dTDP-glucose 4,6-dehydratase